MGWRGRILGAGWAAMLMVLGALSFSPPGAAAATHGPSTVLAGIARAAGRHPLPFPGRDQFAYVRTSFTQGLVFARHLDERFADPTSNYPTAPQAAVTSTQDSWTSPGRAGVEYFRAGPARFLSAADRAAWVRDRRPRLQPATGHYATPAAGYAIGGETVSRAEILAVSHRPRTVYHEYFERYGAPASALNLIGEALAVPGLPPALRVTLIRALALVPGVRVVTHARDNLGRAGVGLLVSRDGTSTEVVLDPRTGRVLGITLRLPIGGAFLHGRVVAIRNAAAFSDPAVTDTRGRPPHAVTDRGASS